MKKHYLIACMIMAVSWAVIPSLAEASQGYWLYYDTQSGAYSYYMPGQPIGGTVRQDALETQLKANTDAIIRDMANLNNKINQVLADSKTKEKLEALASAQQDKDKSSSTQLASLIAENQVLKLKLEMTEKSKEMADNTNKQLMQNLANLGSSNQNVTSLVNNALSQTMSGLNALTEKFNLLTQGVCPSPKA